MPEFEPNISNDAFHESSTPNRESLVQPDFEPPQPTLQRLLFGDDGLRAGWSVLVYLLLVALVATCLKFAVDHFHLMPQRTPGAKELAPFGMAIG